MQIKHFSTALIGTACVFAFLLFLGVYNYGGNISALLHMDVPFGELHNVPKGLVLYKDAAYDGMLYYQVARDIPELFSGEQTSLDSPYRFQRILLPLFMYAATFGHEQAFPHALLIINLIASLGALAVMLLMVKVNVHALTVVANPAILVGMLYMLTEPLSLFFIVLFLYFWEKNKKKLNTLTIFMLILSLFARETTVFLMGLLFLWYAWHKQWKQALFTMIPLPLFIFWQYFLTLQFGDIGFQANSNVVSLPFGGPVQLILWLFEGLNTYRLSAFALLLFVLALFIALGKEWIQKRQKVDVYCFLLSGLCATMLMMDAHMWGAITSIGRVVTPIYPVYALYAASKDTWVERTISVILIVVSIVAAIGIASVRHPFIVS